MSRASYVAWILSENGARIDELRSERPGTMIWGDNHQIVALAGRDARYAIRVTYGGDRWPHPIAPISSRPISMRRISLVPAPISISFASRKMRATGVSFMKPMPPIACTA